MKKESNQMLRVLLPIASLIGAATILWAVFVVSSKPKGYHAQVIAEFSPDGKRAFWFDPADGLLRVTDLDTWNQTEIAELEVRQVEWSNSGDTLFFVTSAQPRQFGWVSLSDREIHQGPDAEYFTRTAEPDQVLLFAKPEGPIEMRSYRIGEEMATEPKALFESKIEEYGRITGARLSPDSALLGVCMQGNRGVSTLEVRRVEDWSPVIQREEHAEFIFFAPDNRRMMTVRNTAAIIALHNYDLVSGSLTKSGEQIHGWCEAAQTTPDRLKLAMGLVGQSKKTNHIELYETSTLARVAGVKLPGERSVITLSFAGENLFAIGRSGRLWKWHAVSGEVTRLEWVNTPAQDMRWSPLIAGLIIYGILWGVMIYLRRRSSIEIDSNGKPRVAPARSNAVILLLVACVFEVCKLTANFLEPMQVIGEANMMLVMGHVILAVTVVILVASMAILKIPAKWPLLVAAALVLAAGAGIDFFIWAASVASV